MFILGLTGSIGMGKSTAAAMFRRLGVPVHDADAAVHRLMAPGGAAVGPVLAAFPEAAGKDGGIDRRALGAVVFKDTAALHRLERILHPLVGADERRFLARAARRRAPLVVLDVPLLYETGGERRCDAVLVVTAPPFLQRARVMARPGMTEERLATILAKQTSDTAKRARAAFVVPTGFGRLYPLRRITGIVKILRQRQGRRWPIAPRGKDIHARSRPRHRNHRSRPGKR
jgi:dephospho-CoA kinase